MRSIFNGQSVRNNQTITDHLLSKRDSLAAYLAAHDFQFFSKHPPLLCIRLSSFVGIGTAFLLDLTLLHMKSVMPIILVLGPTAGGKTEFAIELAKKLPGGGECICADSMQIYRKMDIGTAKPTLAEQAQVPHHLFDLVDADFEGFSVDTWLELAEQTITDIRKRKRYPIIVGGTNLYIQALLQGLFDGPEPDLNLRAELEALVSEELRERLLQIDPPAAERIHLNDRKRTIRAIEVHQLTGKRISDLQEQWTGGPIRSDLYIIGLDYEVPTINGRINARVKIMMDEGLVEEVKQLVEEAGLSRQAAEALGYRQILDHLSGKISLDEAVEQIKIRTRRFAKQQRTWLRRFRSHPNSTWLNANDKSSQELVNKALTSIASSSYLVP